MERRATWIVALLAVVLLPPLYLRGLDGSALLANDEVIYADMAREMVAGGHVSEVRYDGDVYFPRPPASFWAIAAVQEVIGAVPLERPIRFVTTLLPAIEVALTIWLGYLLFSPFVGIVGGLLLATADLFVGYARVFESEPLLCCFVLASFGAWVGARQRTWLFLVYGVLLGAALMTKQLVGLLPLAAPLAELWVERRLKRGLGIALLVALIVALPWHVLMLVRHGSRFIDSYLLQSLVVRSQVSLLRKTSALFYLRELWRSEHAPFAVAWLAGAVCALYVGLTKRRFSELLVGGWALGPLVLFSLARSRYDYYLLVAYPAFALAMARLALYLSPRLRVIVAVALVVASAVVHLPHNLEHNPGMAEVRDVVKAATGVDASVPLYVFNLRPYAARLYSGRHVHAFVDEPRDVAAAEALRAGGMPAPAELVTPASVFTQASRPSLLLVPTARTDLPGAGERVLAESPHYRLYLLSGTSPR